jgi:hypothetical protein
VNDYPAMIAPDQAGGFQHLARRYLVQCPASSSAPYLDGHQPAMPSGSDRGMR